MAGLWDGFWSILAQGAQDGAAPGGQPQTDMNEMLTKFLIPMVAMFALFYFLMIRPQKREQADRQKLLNALKKNDRVVTIGGISRKRAHSVPSNMPSETPLMLTRRMPGTTSSVCQVGHS